MNKNNLIDNIITVAKEGCTGDCFDCKYNYTYTYEDDDFGDVPTKGCMFDLVGTNYSYSGLSEEAESLFKEIKDVCDSYPAIDDNCCDYCPLNLNEEGCICDSVTIEGIRKGNIVLVKDEN